MKKRGLVMLLISSMLVATVCSFTFTSKRVELKKYKTGESFVNVSNADVCDVPVIASNEVYQVNDYGFIDTGIALCKPIVFRTEKSHAREYRSKAQVKDGKIMYSRMYEYVSAGKGIYIWHGSDESIVSSIDYRFLKRINYNCRPEAVIV